MKNKPKPTLGKTQYYIEGYTILKSNNLDNTNSWWLTLYDSEHEALYALKDKCQETILDMHKKLRSIQKKIDHYYET